MSTQAYQEAVQNVIYLVRCAINGETPDKSRLAGINLEHLYRAANRHPLGGNQRDGAGICGYPEQGIYMGFHLKKVHKNYANHQLKSAPFYAII